MEAIKIPNFKGYIEVTPEVFNKIDDAQIANDVIKQHRAQPQKPEWITGDVVARSYAWHGYLIVEGR
jgi:hypothetical protein